MKRGFSLVEVLLVLGLLALVAGLSLLQARGARSAMDTRGAALRLAAELRAARQRAITLGERVTFEFPTGGGTRPHFQSFLVREGTAWRRVDLSRDYPEVFLVIARWPLQNRQLTHPETYDQPWSGGNPAVREGLEKEHYLVFNPDGTIGTNKLALFDQSLHIVAATGLRFRRTGPPPGRPPLEDPPGYFRLDAVSQPVTLSVGSAGQVKVESGLTAGKLPSMPPGPPALPPARVEPPNSRVEPSEARMAGLTARPEGNPATSPGAVPVDAASVLTVTARVKAQHRNGLKLEWSCTGGAFSGPSELGGCDQLLHEATSSWRPPAGGKPGQRFTLSCQVRDENGNLSAPATLTAEWTEPGTLVFCQGGDVLRARGDGTATRNLTRAHPELHGQCRQAVLASAVGPLCVAANHELYLLQCDGSLPDRLTRDGQPKSQPCWAPDGRRLAYVADGHVRVLDVLKRGDEAVSLEGSHPSWSPDGKRLAFLREGDLWLYDLTRGEAEPLLDGPLSAPAWNPSGSLLAFEREGTLWVVSPVGGAARPLRQAGERPCWAPDGNRIAFQQPRGLGILDVAPDGSAVNPRQLLPEGQFPHWR
ncbi:MAG: GspH/FimT family pseudopilin [Candidatus Eremiobacterota bacterium]